MLFLISLSAGLVFGAIIFALIIAMDKMLNHAHQNLFKFKFSFQFAMRTPFKNIRTMKHPKLI